MAKKISPLLPSTDELLCQFGDRLRLARQRRRLSAKQVAERAGMSPMTLRSLERGGSGVTIGAYLAVMQVLGIERDLALLGHADPMGRELQDARMGATYTVREKRTATAALTPSKPSQVEKAKLASLNHESWQQESGFIDSETLAGLITPVEPLPNNRR
jgi:transcriptional regulator with XRE-family HTH domain